MKLDARGAEVERVNGALKQGRPLPVGWDYRTDKMEPDAPLDQYGTEGWELVSVVPVPGDPGLVFAYFKRRRG